MNQAVKAQEPSMEEILASIRRIIADDDGAKPATPAEAPPRPVVVPPPAPAPNSQKEIDAMLADIEAKQTPPAPAPAAQGAEAPAAEVLDLTESMTASPPPPPTFRTIDPNSDVVFADRPAEPAPRVVEDPRRPFTPPADRGLLSTATASAVDSAFNSLAQTVLGANARTLEDLVREMLRPMLKSWLDDNLPGLVERIVRDEIERVARGRR